MKYARNSYTKKAGYSKRGRKPGYKKRYMVKPPLINRLANDGVITRKITAFAPITENNTYNNATAIINWFGSLTASTGNASIKPLTELDHTDPCLRFKYFKVVYCKVEVFVHDVVGMNNESMAYTYGYGQIHIMSDVLEANLTANVNNDVIQSRADYKTYPCQRGKVYTKGFRAQQYLKKHHPQLAGWMLTDAMSNMGNLFHTGVRLDTVNVGSDSPIARVQATVIVQYKNYKVNGI